jgi:hypothetical protein
VLNALPSANKKHQQNAHGDGDDDAAAAPDAATFDPIDFLNKFYTSEAVLTQQLPVLREAVAEKMHRLDDRISTALQRQSETADSTRRHVQEAKASVEELKHRILQVRDKASQSEAAVLEITKEMKRLDCAKQHLQRTITTLKRLHMLVNAVEQLRICCAAEPFPDYVTASQLVDATKLLMTYFSGYTNKVQPMRLLSRRITGFQVFLRSSLIRGFRIVGFGLQKTKEMEGTAKPKPEADSFLLGSDEDDDEVDDLEELQHPVMTPDIMRGGVLLVDALGDTMRDEFISGFCQDHLASYAKEFEPPSKEPKQQEKRVSSFKVQIQSDEEKEKLSGLDNIEKRFIWFQQMIQDVDRKFPKVFPSNWNVQASMARYFLQLVSADGRNNTYSMLSLS